MPSPNSSSSSSLNSTSSNFWSRNFIIASSNPTQLQGGRQLQGAPLCPCHDCWEYGSHALAPPKAPKAPKTIKVVKDKRSLLQFFKWENSSNESVSSDLRPLKQCETLMSTASSV
ncbi:hypothetical protein SEPCBS57363_000541 [Sporothrix epigloea]|uniref:Uncharacterized protein n=1 Tax=Sporothrix epigloea TaxID=1892477 RepID=A0ABP0D7N0_9PEZI